MTLGQEKTQKELEEATKKLFEKEKEIEAIKGQMFNLQINNVKLKEDKEKIERKHRALLFKRMHYKFKEGQCFYLIEIDKEKRIFKFGITKDINQRLRTYRTAIPN